MTTIELGEEKIFLRDEKLARMLERADEKFEFSPACRADLTRFFEGAKPLELVSFVELTSSSSLSFVFRL